ncbi:hypothetical protein [Kordiimonas aestuarii]|uniref:hypothetical protein n=1 Tax=Kordiimonas aestuarii TaxID=1005925 RepID=UPI0021CE6A79|nr:hypothetical protein [Kordiimonas aestuarii]
MASARLLPWLIVVFVAAQIMATAHASAYGSSKHLHDGHPCIISTACKHLSDADLAKPGPVIEPPVWHEFHEALLGAAAVVATVRIEAIRGPPPTH